MAAHDIKKHFKGLRVDTGRRKSRDPFSTGFEDDSDDSKERRSRSKTKQAPPVEKPVAPTTTSVSSPFYAIDAVRDSDDDFLDKPQRTDRRPSPAPFNLPLSRVTDGAGRRGSLDQGLQSRGLQINRAPRSAVAQAAGTLAYLDDSDEEDDSIPPPPSRTDRYPSPAPRKQSDPVDPLQRSSTPKSSREPLKEQSQTRAQPSKHTVASPFAGTKYLEDSDSESYDHDEDEEAVGSRSNSIDEATPEVTESPDKHDIEVKRVDKPKQQNGSGISWRAFSAGRAEQRNSEIEALQASLKQRGKSISFHTHALTDDGNRVPIPIAPEQIFGGATRGRAKGRRQSPPRRAGDTEPTDDEILDGGPVGVYDPTQYKTNPFTATRTEIPTSHEATASNDRPVPPAASLTSSSEISPSVDPWCYTPSVSPTDVNDLSNGIGSVSSSIAVSPPQTIPESKAVDHAMDSLASPSDEIRSPPSRDSSVRSLRSTGTLPTRIPNVRRSSRRSTSGTNMSTSPAHAFLASWKNNGNDQTPAEPKPDDDGQAIGLKNEYIIGKVIGQGGFGVVKEIHTINAAGDRVVQAVKIVRKTIPKMDEAENERAQQELEHEISVWRHLKHSRILDLQVVFDTDFATFCVMDFNQGKTLHALWAEARAGAASNDGLKGLAPDLAKRYAYQLACALRYLHEDIRVCHRDVKMENCLIDMSGSLTELEGGNLRLCDFGLADFLHSDRSTDEMSAERLEGVRTTNLTTASIIGTLEYASPKGLSVHRKLFETAGDVWAFGVVVYAVCTGELPFRHALQSKTVELILQAEWDESALLSAAAGGSEVKDLVEGCLEKDIEIRFMIADALRSGWFEECREFEEERPRSVFR